MMMMLRMDVLFKAEGVPLLPPAVELRRPQARTPERRR